MLWQRIVAATRPTRSRAAQSQSSKSRNSFTSRRLTLESLESRALMAVDLTPSLSAPSFRPTLAETTPQWSSSPNNNGYSPNQIRHAYGFDQVMFGSVRGDGTGQTIAIIDAYHAPTIAHDLHAFDVAFGLPDPPSFRVVAQDGSTNYPRTDPDSRGTLNWETETALDVEWAHALAPAANILLVEANAATSDDLIDTAVNYARRQPGVSVITMSFGSNEYSAETLSDPGFTSVAGHGVTFVAASGDSGTPGIYPSVSPNVVSIGGTRLSVDGTGNYIGESGWSGSNGGISRYEPTPGYQNGAMPGLWRRGSPDVAFDADPYSGVPVYDSYNGGNSPWVQIGGTSFSSPAWAALIAVANQGRAINGLASLDGPTQTLPLLYSVSSTDFHDVTTGSNGLSAGAGYDLVTGRGTPIATRLVADMATATTFGNGNGGGSGGGGFGGGTTPPVNDNFAAAGALSGVSASAVGWNVNSTQQAGEPNVARVSGGHSVWWNWTAPASGTVVVTTAGSDFDTTLGVFTGSAVNTLTSIVANDDEAMLLGVYTSLASFTAVGGTTYRLAVDGYHGATGNILLALNETIPPPVPQNDSFANRVTLTGATVSTTGANASATLQSGEPKIAGITGGHSVWYSWTAPTTGQVTISTAGSDFDTLLGVYTGTAVNKLTPVATNDDQNVGAGILTSRVSFRATAGKTYQIAVDGYRGATGHITLGISGGTATNVVSPAAKPATSNAATIDHALLELLGWQFTASSGKKR